MGEIKSGSEAAKEAGVALAVLYNHIRAGRVVNRKAGGWPLGKGIEVDMDEVNAALASSRAKGGARAPRRTKADKELAHTIHGALEAEASSRKRKRVVDENGDPVQAVRLHRYNREEQVLCPVDPSHGPLRQMDRTSKGKPLYCGHVAHDGRSAHQLGGFSPQTQNFFTPEEARIEQPAGRFGVIMLEWLYNGRTDLAEELEEWLEQHELTVWLPERT